MMHEDGHGAGEAVIANILIEPKIGAIALDWLKGCIPNRV